MSKTRSHSKDHISPLGQSLGLPSWLCTHFFLADHRKSLIHEWLLFCDRGIHLTPCSSCFAKKKLDWKQLGAWGLIGFAASIFHEWLKALSWQTLGSTIKSRSNILWSIPVRRGGVDLPRRIFIIWPPLAARSVHSYAFKVMVKTSQRATDHVSNKRRQIITS